MASVFLHGLDSSSRGTKGRWFAERFPGVRMRDYDGDLSERLAELADHVTGLDELILIGSSFGGLMAVSFAVRYPERCRRLVLLAPALNSGGYGPPEEPRDVDVLAVMGAHDTVCPPEVVAPLVRASFRAPEIRIEDDDHLLHQVFPTLDWPRLLS